MLVIRVHLSKAMLHMNDLTQYGHARGDGLINVVVVGKLTSKVMPKSFAISMGFISFPNNVK